MSDTTQDAVTENAETPDTGALHQAYDDAVAQDCYTDGRMMFVERVRYGIHRGRDWDGLFHREQGADDGWRYDGMPDNFVALADDIINYGVALDVTAFWGAQMKTSPVSGKTLNAAEAGELRSLVNWLKYGPLFSELIEQVEIAAQQRWMLGWCALHPTWRNRKLMKMQRLTMEQIFQIAAAQKPQSTSPLPSPQGGEGESQPVADSPTVAPQSLLAHLPEMVLDPALEDASAEMFQQFFPDFDKREAKRVIRQLRESGEAEFPVEEESSIGPEIGVLIPWVHFFMAQEATANPGDGRIMFVRKQIPKWMVDQLAAEEEWTDKDFVEKLKESAGNSQMPPMTKEDDRDINRNLCELVYAFRMAKMNDAGVSGVWCTVMSPQVRGTSPQPSPQSGEGEGNYGKNWFLDLSHGKLPFVFSRLEAVDSCITDTRGVCDMVLTQQLKMKTQADAVDIQAQLSNTPPIQRFSGFSSKSMPSGLGPFAFVNSSNPANPPYKPLNLTEGSRPELAAGISEAARKEAEDKFGVPRKDTPPELSQMKRQKLTNQSLAAWGEVFHQLAMLAYQNMEDDELQDILGHKPLLTAEIIAHHKIFLTYDTRTGDGDTIDRITKTATAFIQSGLADDLFKERFARFFWNFVDPTAAAEFLPQDDTNKQKVFKDVRDEINSVMLGNKPTLSQMDPAARVKLQFAQQIIAGNPDFQARLTPKVNGQDNPNFHPGVAENMATLMKNWQHSYQETVLSKAQGRLGVKDTGSFPVGTGTEN